MRRHNGGRYCFSIVPRIQITGFKIEFDIVYLDQQCVPKVDGDLGYLAVRLDIE